MEEDRQNPHKRRVRYSGTHPTRFSEKYKEHDPEKYRDVIHLFYYEELSVKEIARVTGRGTSTVTSQLTRGRELLRKSLKEEYDFG